MKIPYNWFKNTSLIFLLVLLPLENVYADGCDHGYEKLATISVILMIVAASIIFTFIFAEGKELLVKVIAFCVLFVLICCFLFYFSLFFVAIFGFEFYYLSSIIFAIIILYIFLRSSKKEKDIIRKYVFLFFALFFVFIFSNGNNIINFYISITCEYSGGELKKGFCGAPYCKMP